MILLKLTSWCVYNGGRLMIYYSWKRMLRHRWKCLMRYCRIWMVSVELSWWCYSRIGWRCCWKAFWIVCLIVCLIVCWIVCRIVCRIVCITIGHVGCIVYWILRCDIHCDFSVFQFTLEIQVIFNELLLLSRKCEPKPVTAVIWQLDKVVMCIILFKGIHTTLAVITSHIEMSLYRIFDSMLNCRIAKLNRNKKN